MKRDLKVKTLFLFLISVSIINALTLQPKSFSKVIQRQQQQLALRNAIKEGNVKRVRDLIEKGAQVNVKKETPPLIFAASIATTEDDDKIMAKITKELLRKNANPAVKDRFDRTPLIWAAKNGAYKVLKALLGTKEGKATIDMQDNEGNTALIQATIVKTTDKRHLEIAKKLLKKGAKPNIMNYRKKTALFYAEQAGNTEMINLLRSYMPKTVLIRKPRFIKRPKTQPRRRLSGPPMTIMPKTQPRRRLSGPPMTIIPITKPRTRLPRPPMTIMPITQPRQRIR